MSKIGKQIKLEAYEPSTVLLNILKTHTFHSTTTQVSGIYCNFDTKNESLKIKAPVCQNKSKSVSFIYTRGSDKSRILIFNHDLWDNLNCMLFESESTDCLFGLTCEK